MTDPLAKLFGSPARTKLLRLFLFNPGEAFSVIEAARRARTDAAATRRELALFSSIKLLRRSGGARYVLNDDFAYLSVLRALLLNAANLGADLYNRFRSAGNVRLIIASGVFAGEWDGRLDLLVVGDRISERRLQSKISVLEAELGRELHYALLSTPEFYYRLNMSDKLVRDVLDYNHTVVHDRLNLGL